MELLDSLQEPKKTPLSFSTADWIISIYHHFKVYPAITCFGTFYSYYCSMIQEKKSPKQNSLIAMINIAQKADTDFYLKSSDYAKEELEVLSILKWQTIVPTAEKYIYLLCQDKPLRKLCYLLVFLRFIYKEFSEFSEKQIARSAYHSMLNQSTSLSPEEQRCAVLFSQKCNSPIPKNYTFLHKHLSSLDCPEIREYFPASLSPKPDKRKAFTPKDKKYVTSSSLGKGAYSTVFSAKFENENFALKQFTELVDASGINSSIIKEVGFLVSLNHPNILSIKDLVIEKKKLGIVLKKYDTTLRKHVFETSPDLDEMKDIMIKILKGIDYLHSNNILHRDIKSDNIFITKKDNKVDELVIADFGFMIQLNDIKMSSVIATPNYRPPEIFYAKNQYYNSSVDMWSVGCVFAELFINRYLFYDEYVNNTEQRILSQIFRFVSPPNQEVFDEFYKNTRNDEETKNFDKALARAKNSSPCSLPTLAGEFLMSFLNIDPNKRISAKEALEHPFLRL